MGDAPTIVMGMGTAMSMTSATVIKVSMDIRSGLGLIVRSVPVLWDMLGWAV